MSTRTAVKEALKPWVRTARRVRRGDLRIADIVYGQPSFSQFGEDRVLEQIFGDRPLQHGAEEEPKKEEGTGLPPDLPHDGRPVDPNAPEAGGTIAPSTEFGSTGG